MDKRLRNRLFISAEIVQTKYDGNNRNIGGNDLKSRDTFNEVVKYIIRLANAGAFVN